MPSSEFVRHIAARLRTIRERSGVTEEQLEKQLILGPGWVRRIEAGEVVPSIDTLLVMLTLLDASMTDLIDGLDTHASGAEIQRAIIAEPKGSNLVLHFQYGNYGAQYILHGASLQEFESVLEILRDRLANLTEGHDQGAIKSDAVAKAFLAAVQMWPNINPSDLWWFVIYRAYCDPFNHPARFASLNLEQSWKRTSGWALEQVCVRFYGPYLREHGIHLIIATGQRKLDLIGQLDVADRLEADKVDVLLAGEISGAEVCFGVVHVKASFAERRTDDVPMSQALIRAGYSSPLWTMDAKGSPSATPENKGELGAALGSGDDARSAKRKDIEVDGYFSACFSYNTKTVPTPRDQDTKARISTCDFASADDTFSRFIISEWNRIRSS